MKPEDQLHRLLHGDREVRDGAFDAIAASKDPALLEPLVGLATPDHAHIEALLCRYLVHRPAAVALPHLRKLLDSSNEATRRHGLVSFETFDIEERLPMLVDMISSTRRDVVLAAVAELGRHRRSVAIEPMRPLLASSDVDLATAAIEALRHIEVPRVVRLLSRYVQHGDVVRQVAAIDALGRMESFRRWRRLRPGLKASDPIVRQAAVRSISRKGGSGANRTLIDALALESDAETAKLIIGRLALHPDRRVAAALLPLAAGHQDAQVRRAAGWVVEELDDDLLRATALDLLRHAPEEVQAYVLTKLGMRQFDHCGDVIAAHATTAHPPRVLYAALEGLGFLGDGQYLRVVEPFIASQDAMASYVATLAAAQLVDRLSDSPALMSVLSADQESEQVVLKQVVLQFMIDAIRWDYDDPQLLAALQHGLTSPNENIRYLSTILLGRIRGRLELAESLLAVAVEEANPEVRDVAATSLDAVLEGDLTSIFALLEDDTRPPHPYLDLLARMTWDSASARQGLTLFEDLAGRLDASHHGIFQRLATKVFDADPEGGRLCFMQGDPDNAWRHALGEAWLASLGSLTLGSERDGWHVLFESGDDELIVAAAAASQAGATWAIQPIVEHVVNRPDAAMAPVLRRTTQVLLGL